MSLQDILGSLVSGGMGGRVDNGGQLAPPEGTSQGSGFDLKEAAGLAGLAYLGYRAFQERQQRAGQQGAADAWGGAGMTAPGGVPAAAPGGQGGGLLSQISGALGSMFGGGQQGAAPPASGGAWAASPDNWGSQQPPAGGGGGPQPAGAWGSQQPPGAWQQRPAGVPDDAQSRLLIRAMIAAAAADGQISWDERRAILAHVDAGNPTPDERAFVEQQLDNPPRIDDVVNEVRDPQTATQVYQAASLAVRRDSPGAQDFLRWLGRRLAIPPEQQV